MLRLDVFLLVPLAIRFSKQEQKEDIKSIISRGFNVGKPQPSDHISVQEFILFINCVLWPSNDVISMMMVFANFDPDCSGTMDLDEFFLGVFHSRGV